MERLRDVRLGEEMWTWRSPAGLRVVVVPKPGYQKTFAACSVRYGSIDQSFFPPGYAEPVHLPAGIAHFLEHKMFAQEYGDVFERFASLGASANAFTSHTTTTYLFSTVENFPPAMELLLDFVQHPYFTDENVAREQEIIEQEILMYLDDPGWRGYQNLLEAMYRVHPLRVDIAGTVDSIREITPEKLHLCHRTFYQPANMVVSVVGQVDPEEVFALCRSNPDEGPAAAGPPRREYPTEPAGVEAREVSRRMAVSRPFLRLGFKDVQTLGESGEALLRRQIIASALLELVFGRSSPLYEDLYRDKLIDDTFSAQYEGESDFGFSMVGGRTGDPERLLARIRRELRAVGKRGVGREDWRRLQKKGLGEYLAVFNSPEAISHLLTSYAFQGISLFAYQRVLAGIEAEELEGRLRGHLNEETLAASTILPR